MTFQFFFPVQWAVGKGLDTVAPLVKHSWWKLAVFVIRRPHFWTAGGHVDRSPCVSTFMMHDRDGFFSFQLNKRTEIKHSFIHTDPSLICAFVCFYWMDIESNFCKYAEGFGASSFHFLPGITDMHPHRLRIWKRILPPSLVVLVNVSVKKPDINPTALIA